MVELLARTVAQVLTTLAHSWPYLAFSVVVAAILKVHVDPARVKMWLARHQRASVLGAMVVAVATPLCSCGTMALVLAMLATSMPWAPIVAFMVASPLTSPGQLLYTAGLFGWTFASFHFVIAITLGLAGALIAAAFEARGWLANQTRLSTTVHATIAGGSDAHVVVVTAGRRHSLAPRMTAYVQAIIAEGRRLGLLFLIFAFIGYFLNNLIPSTWVTSLFGSGKTFGVAFAAVLGLPLYVNSDASLPLVKAFLDGGASPGAAMAFLVTGAGTSIGAVVGALTIARWRVLAVVVGTLCLGAIVSGYVFDALLAGQLLVAR
jgi:uncharacterized membrane protein YraQ (UPF0718 family)